MTADSSQTDAPQPAESSQTDALRVGFVGLGNIGKPMALRLASSDSVDLHVYDVMPKPIAELVSAGANEATSVADLALATDVLCVMVRDDDQVREVLDSVLGVVGQRPGDRPPLAVVVHSTVAPPTPASLQETAASHGVLVLDAPVSGGAMGAADGTLAVLVGGSDEAYAAARPVLERLGSKVVHAGPIGAGTQFKLARNLMHFVAFTAAAEAQRLAEAAGLDLVKLGDVVRHTDAVTGGPGAIMHRNSTAPLAEDDFWFGLFDPVRRLGEKDLGFAIELADQLGVDVPLARLAFDRLGSALGIPGAESSQIDTPTAKDNQ